jgi:hypothetical protein
VIGRSLVSKTIGYRTKDARAASTNGNSKDPLGTIETTVAPSGPGAPEDTGHIPAMRCYRGHHPLLIGEIGPIRFERHDYGLADMFEDRFSPRISETRQKAVVPWNRIALWPKIYEETTLLALSEGHPAVFNGERGALENRDKLRG